MFSASQTLLAIAALLTGTLSLSVVKNAANDVDEKLDKRIVSGKDAKPNSFPFIASLKEYWQGRWDHTCGGVLIAPQWVLTAAHCVWDKEWNEKYSEKILSMFNVVFGEHDTERKSVYEQWKEIEDVKVHPGYSAEDPSHHDDIALIKLKSPVTTNKNVTIARISRDVYDNLQKADCVLVGWGTLLKSDGDASRYLQQASMELVPWKECWKSYRGARLAFISRTQVCVKHKTTSANEYPSSACSGDSGGPMMCGGGHDVITGVSSFVALNNEKRCNTENHPNVYTRVAAYTGWIEGYTGDLKQYTS